MHTSLSAFVQAVFDRDQHVTVYGAEGDEATARIADFFGDGVTVTDGGATPGLITRFSTVRDDDRLAITTRGEFGTDYILVTPAFEVVGTTGRDLEVPEYALELGEASFRVPAGNKALMIELSRYIESLALDAGSGTIYTGVQELARLVSEKLTQSTYRKLAASGVETHVFGGPTDGDSGLPGVSTHPTRNEEIASTWFVVYGTPESGRAALVAEETAANTFRGFWSYEEPVVAEVIEYIEGTHLAASVA